MLSENSIKELRTNLRGGLIEPGDQAYDEARKVYNGMIHKRPRLIARCADAADVIHSVNFSRVRIGIGAAAAEPVEHHHDLFGCTVQLAARLCSHASPEQIIASSRLLNCAWVRTFYSKIWEKSPLKVLIGQSAPTLSYGPANRCKRRVKNCRCSCSSKELIT